MATGLCCVVWAVDCREGGLSIGAVGAAEACRAAAGAGVTEPPRYSPTVIRVNSHCIPD